MVEHCMIDHALRVYFWQCANKRRDLDTYERFALSSSEDEQCDTGVVYSCYVAYGLPLQG